MPGNTFYETIFNGVIFGIAYFAVDWLLKLADDQEEMLSQLEELEEKISQCEEKLSQCKEAVN